MSLGTLPVADANRFLSGLTAPERLLWAVDQFHEGAILLSSMQKTACVLMHLFYTLGLENEILFVDTGFHFHETLALRDEFLRRYRLNIVTLYPRQTPEEQERLYGRKLHLFVDGQPECCKMRKTEPYLEHMRLRGRQLKIDGLRKGEDGQRGEIGILTTDPRIDGLDLHPLADWTSQQVDDYLAANEVPIHPLYQESYLSIGCACCTTPVQPGEDERAGRWRHLRAQDTSGPVYCGINFSDGSGI